MSSTSLLYPHSFSSSSSSGSSSSGIPLSPLTKMRRLDNLYEVTNHIDDVTLYYHLARCDLIMIKEAIKDAKWRIVMDKEIASIEKNDI
jgi:hypothetical protein